MTLTLYSEYLRYLMQDDTNEKFWYQLRTELMVILVCGYDRVIESYRTDYNDAHSECRGFGQSLTEELVLEIAIKYNVASIFLVDDCSDLVHTPNLRKYA